MSGFQTEMFVRDLATEFKCANLSLGFERTRSDSMWTQVLPSVYTQCNQVSLNTDCFLLLLLFLLPICSKIRV